MRYEIPNSIKFIAMVLLIYISFIVCVEAAFTPPIWDTSTTSNMNNPASNSLITRGNEQTQKIQSTNYQTTVQKAYFPSNYDSPPIEIEKSIEPNEVTDYVVNTPINICVIIRSGSSYNLTNLKIKEETDENLKIVNNSAKCIIIDPMCESFNMINFTHGCDINNINDNTLNIAIPCLRPQKWIAYTYTAIPQKKGRSGIDTIVSFGNNPYYKNKYFPWEVEIKPEKFDISLAPSKDVEYSYTDINLVYKIKYLGNNPNSHIFNISLDESSKEFICVKNKTQNLTFNSEEYQYYYPAIQYQKIGNHYFPTIIIDDIPYSASGPQIITIDDYIIRNKDSLNFWVSILNILVAIFNIIIFIFISLGYREFINIENTLQGIQRELQQMREPDTPKENRSPWWYR